MTKTGSKRDKEKFLNHKRKNLTVYSEVNSNAYIKKNQLYKQTIQKIDTQDQRDFADKNYFLTISRIFTQFKERIIREMNIHIKKKKDENDKKGTRKKSFFQCQSSSIKFPLSLLNSNIYQTPFDLITIYERDRLIYNRANRRVTEGG